MLQMYGIPNCDTIRKARKWLDEHAVEYVFHNYKKDGVPEKELRNWVKQAGWEALINRRGTSWRKLDEATRDSMDESAAIRVMLQNPSIIKRPLLTRGKTLLIGFDEHAYRDL